MQKGKVELYTHAMVREVITDADGLAAGVLYIDKKDLREYRIGAKVVVLAASACETARIMLNSKSKVHPNGLSNSSGVVGRYLHDSTGTDRMAFMPELVYRPRYNEDGVGGSHVYSPWWLDNKKLDFPRGYHIEYWGGMSMPSYGFGFGMDTMRKYLLNEFGKPTANGGYGVGLKKDLRRIYSTMVGMSGRGESIPQYDNYCEIDPDTVDKFGIPVLRFHYTWTQHEVRQAKHMHEIFEEILTGMGAVLLGEKPGQDTDHGWASTGRIIHEVGTSRMGDDPKTSALNKYAQAHDCKNLFVVDAGSFVSQADKNPTWTILALSWRTSEYIIDQLKKQNI